MTSDAPAFDAPSADAEQVASVTAGEVIRMLDCTRGWAWGYLPSGLVAYVAATAVRV